MYKIRSWISTGLFMIGISFMALAGLVNPVKLEDMGIDRDEMERDIHEALNDGQ